MTLFLLIYSHMAFGMMGYLLGDWPYYPKLGKGEGAMNIAAIIAISLVWPFPLYIIVREGAKS